MMKKQLICSILILTTVVTSCGDAEIGADNKVNTYEERYKELEQSIRGNKDWMASIEKKAKEQNIPVDSMIKLDITWTLDEQDGKHKPGTQPAPDTTNKKPYEERLKEIIASIKSNAEWMATITKKAKDQKISVDSMMVLDAKWMIDEQDGKHK